MEMVRLDPPAELTMPIGEAMFSQRATRRLDPDRPITDAQLKIILDAASKAPNGALRDPDLFGRLRRCRRVNLPWRTKPAALGACARYRQRTDDLASGGHGTGARNVRYSGRRGVPLLYPVGLPAR